MTKLLPLRLVLPLLSLGLTACSTGFGPDGGTGTSSSGTTTSQGDDGGGSGTDDVWGQVDPDNCTDLPDFNGVAGAASYFIGEYTPAGGPTSGTETWALYANPDWAALGGADCVVVWNMSVSTTSVGVCGACDYGLDVVANIDLSATTCAQDLYAGDESWTASYDVDEKDDGTVDWFFAETGTVIGSGYVSAGVSFITAPSCVWFGAG